MEFKLPFPTLKNLSSLKICLHWADHKLCPFQEFPITWYSKSETLHERHRLSIDGLPIPRSLKAVVGDVLSGIVNQLIIWSGCRQTQLAKEVQFYHFDVFGRFDEQRTLKPVFQKKVTEEDELFFLHTLLTDAYNFWLLSEVDAIFRKMVVIASKRRRSEILMEGPRPKLHHGKYHLVYRFVQEDAAQYLNILRFLNYEDRAKIVLKREGIAVAPCPYSMYWNFDAFKDHFNLFRPSEREAFIEEQVLVRGNRWKMAMKNHLDIFTFLKQKNYRRNWLSELGHGFISWFLEDLLIWPFTSFFIVAFKLLAPNLEWDRYPDHFWLIVQTIPAEQQYGVLHRNLLMDYWYMLTADEKRKCSTSDDVYKAMEKLKVKVPFLHDAIKTELNALVTASDEELLPKRMRLC